MEKDLSPLEPEEPKAKSQLQLATALRITGVVLQLVDHTQLQPKNMHLPRMQDEATDMVRLLRGYMRDLLGMARMPKALAHLPADKPLMPKDTMRQPPADIPIRKVFIQTRSE